MDILENQQIRLRALEPEDLDLLYLWENDSHVWHLGNTLVPFSRYVLKKYLESAHRDIYELKQLRLIIQLKEDDRAVGAIDFFDFNPTHGRAGVGILIAAQEDRRRGYAKEALESLIRYAFQVLQLHQLWCNIGASNTPSLKLFQQAGFVMVGEKKDWVRSSGSSDLSAASAAASDGGYESEFLLQLINPA